MLFKQVNWATTLQFNRLSKKNIKKLKIKIFQKELKIFVFIYYKRTRIVVAVFIFIKLIFNSIESNNYNIEPNSEYSSSALYRSSIEQVVKLGPLTNLNNHTQIISLDQITLEGVENLNNNFRFKVTYFSSMSSSILTLCGGSE